MNNDLLEHRGYYGSVQYSSEDECLVGKVEFIDDLVLYDGEDLKTLKSAFVEAVNDYLATCEAEGKQPDVTCKGHFNVRVGVDLHKRAAALAKRQQQSLNELIKEAIASYLNRANKAQSVTVIGENSLAHQNALTQLKESLVQALHKQRDPEMLVRIVRAQSQWPSTDEEYIGSLGSKVEFVPNHDFELKPTRH